MRLNLLEPVLDIVKCGLLGAVVDENDAHGALVIRLRDRAEALLPRRVPQVQDYDLVLHVHLLGHEVNSNSCLVRVIEAVIDKSMDDTRLADRLVP